MRSAALKAAVAAVVVAADGHLEPGCIHKY